MFALGVANRRKQSERRAWAQEDTDAACLESTRVNVHEHTLLSLSVLGRPAKANPFVPPSQRCMSAVLVRVFATVVLHSNLARCFQSPLSNNIAKLSTSSSPVSVISSPSSRKKLGRAATMQSREQPGVLRYELFVKDEGQSADTLLARAWNQKGLELVSVSCLAPSSGILMFFVQACAPGSWAQANHSGTVCTEIVVSGFLTTGCTSGEHSKQSQGGAAGQVRSGKLTILPYTSPLRCPKLSVAMLLQGPTGRGARSASPLSPYALATPCPVLPCDREL
eukprot:2366837-Rhodomonas_salina.1